MLTETHLKESVRSSEILFHIPGYDIFRSDRAKRECGGVAILMHSSLSGELLGTFDNSVVEFVVVKAYSLNTVFCCIYRPPDTSLREFSQALTELRKLLEELPAPTPTLVLGGDLNFPKEVISWQNVDEILVPSVGENRGKGNGEGPKVRVQASSLIELTNQYNMAQYIDKITHGREILDLIFSNDPNLVHSVSTESLPSFTDHMLVTLRVNYELQKPPERSSEYILDSARRLSRLNFHEAKWQNVREELKQQSWLKMKEIAKLSPTVAHSYLLAVLLPILERNVPPKKCASSKRSKWARKRNFLWRKLKKIKDLLSGTFSVKKILELLDRRDKLQKELSTMYNIQNQEAEAKVIEAMKTNPNEFFRYAKARQKTKSSIGPLLDPVSGKLNADPSFAAEILSQQYSNVFTLPRPEWNISDVRKFFSTSYV